MDYTEMPDGISKQFDRLDDEQKSAQVSVCTCLVQLLKIDLRVTERKIKLLRDFVKAASEEEVDKNGSE